MNKLEKEFDSELRMLKQLDRIGKYFIKKGKHPKSKYYEYELRRIQKFLHDKRLGLAKYYMDDNDDENKIIQFIKSENEESSKKLTEVYLSDKLNDLEKIYTKKEIKEKGNLKVDLRRNPEFAKLYDKYSIINKNKLVIGDKDLSYEDAIKYIGGDILQKYNLKRLYLYLDEKYHNHQKEYILMLATGIYNVINITGFKNIDDKRYFKMTFKKYIYTDMSEDDYALMLALQKGIIGDPKGRTYNLILEKMKDIVVFRGQPKEVKDLPNWKKSLMNKMLEDLDLNHNNFRQGYCLFDFIIKTMQEHKYKFDELIFITQLQKLDIDVLNLTPYDIKKWRDEYYPRIGLYCVDAMKNKVLHQPVPNSINQLFNICWVAHDKHCYPVTDHKICYSFSHSHECDTVKLGQVKYNISYEDGYNIVNQSNILDFVNGEKDYDYEFEEEEDDDFYNKKVCILSPGMSEKHIIYDVLRKTIENTGMAVTQMNSGPYGLNSFVHPITNQILVLNDKLQLRLDVLKKLYDAFNCKQFIFNGQSLTTIGINLRQRLIGEFPKSTYNNYVREVFDKYNVCALVQSLYECKSGKINLDCVQGFDIIKCFSDVQLNMKDYYFAFDIHCIIEPYDNKEIDIGKYYINNTYLPYKCFDEKLLIRKGFYPYNLIKFLLAKKYINKENIIYQCRARQKIKPDILKNYVEYCYNHFDSSIAKNLVNLHNGHLHTKYQKTQYACISTDDDTVFALAFKTLLNDMNDYNIERIGDVYLISKKTEKRLQYDNCPIYEQTVAGSIINLLELIEKVYNPNISQLLGVNTDSCFFYKPNKIKTIQRSEFEIEEEIKDINGQTTYMTKTKENINMLKYLGKYSTEDLKLKIFHSIEEIEKNGLEPYILNLDKITKGKGRITYGGAGCGKTWTMCKEIIDAYKNKKKILVLSFTNKAVKNIKNTLKKVTKQEPDYEMDKGTILKIQTKMRTFNKVFHMCQQSEKGMIKKLSHQDIIFVDEYIMTPNQFMTLLYHSKSNIQLFGDSNQLEPVDDLIYDYSKSNTIKEMCPEIRMLNYIDGCCRFDNELLNKSQKFLKDNIIPEGFKKVNENLYKNICYTNKKRQEIIKDRCTKFINEKGLKGIKLNCYFHYDNKKKQDRKEEYEFCDEMPIIATQNIEYANIYNSEQYTIDKIENGIIYINHYFKLKDKKVQFSLSFEKFGLAFLPAFCVTTHKYQGDTIDEPYNIYEVDKMYKKLFYTAITRATKFKYIHIDSVQYTFKNREYPETIIKENDDGGKYKNGKIYEIFMDDKYYIGKTCTTIEKRFEKHKGDPKSPIYKSTNAKIKLLYNYPCFNNLELLKAEALEISRYILKYGKDKIMNKQRNSRIKKTEIKIEQLPEINEEEKTQANELKTKIIKSKEWSNLKEILEIKDYEKEKYFQIKKMITGVKYWKKIRYGKTKTKEEALKEITKWKNDILNNMYCPK